MMYTCTLRLWLQIIFMSIHEHLKGGYPTGDVSGGDVGPAGGGRDGGECTG